MGGCFRVGALLWIYYHSCCQFSCTQQFVWVVTIFLLLLKWVHLHKWKFYCGSSISSDGVVSDVSFTSCRSFYLKRRTFIDLMNLCGVSDDNCSSVEPIMRLQMAMQAIWLNMLLSLNDRGSWETRLGPFKFLSVCSNCKNAIFTQASVWCSTSSLSKMILLAMLKAHQILSHLYSRATFISVTRITVTVIIINWKSCRKIWASWQS